MAIYHLLQGFELKTVNQLGFEHESPGSKAATLTIELHFIDKPIYLLVLFFVFEISNMKSTNYKKYYLWGSQLKVTSREGSPSIYQNIFINNLYQYILQWAQGARTTRSWGTNEPYVLTQPLAKFWHMILLQQRYKFKVI